MTNSDINSSAEPVDQNQHESSDQPAESSDVSVSQSYPPMPALQRDDHISPADDQSNAGQLLDPNSSINDSKVLSTSMLIPTISANQPNQSKTQTKSSLSALRSSLGHDDDESEDEDDLHDIPAPSNNPARNGLADPSAALRALEKHTVSRPPNHPLGVTTARIVDQTHAHADSHPVRARRSRPDIWSCFLGCGQNYRKSSGRSIRRHVIACFREYYPVETADLTDGQLNDLLATRQETGSIDTGLRTWRLRQQRRNAGDLPINERWQCPNSCGRCYRATSVKSIQKHMMNCLGPMNHSTGQKGSIHSGIAVAAAEYSAQMARAIPANLVPAMLNTPTSNTTQEWRQVQVAQPINLSLPQSVVQGIGRPGFPMAPHQFMFMNQSVLYPGMQGVHLQQMQSLNPPISQGAAFMQQTSTQTKSSPQTQQSQQQQQQYVYPWPANAMSTLPS